MVRGEPRVYRDHVDPHWFSGDTRFWYRNDLADGRREFVLVDAEKGQRSPAFDHARVAAGLSKVLKREIASDRLPVDSIRFDDGGKSLYLIGADGTWTLHLESYEISRAPTEDSDRNSSTRLEPTRRVHPTRRTGEPTKVTFVNRTNDSVEIFWIDTEGRRTSYGSLAPGARRELNTYAGHVWLVARAGGDVLAVFEAGDEPGIAQIDGRERAPGRRNGAPSAGASVIPSPDGKWEAFVRDGNLWIRDRQTHEETQLSSDGSEKDTYHRDVYRDRAIGLNYNRPDAPATLPEAYWSPDSRHLVAIRTKTATAHEVHYVESSPSDQLQPRLHVYPYLKAGDEIPIRKPHLFNLEQKKPIPISGDLFTNPWDISDIRWDADSSRFTFLYNQRGHQALRIIAVDARTGGAKPIVDEQSKTFIDYSGKFFCDYLDETREIVWMSERDGWNHLYLYDASSEKVKNAITHGGWVVRGVDRVDHGRRQVWFHAGGIRPGQDPYFVNYCRANLDGSGLVILTEGNGNHSVRFSPDRKYLIDTWSRVDFPPITELRSAEDGHLICRLEEADASEILSARHHFPEPFVAKGRDGMTDIYGVIYRPADFDSGKKYPVIESIYAGPQDSYVPKSFRASFGQQRLADRGFIVVQIDGMGTSNRSKAFHDVCWKNLGDGGFPDRILWMKAAAARYPQMDLTRVGIYGTSAGGQNALRGLLAHGDFYTCGVADSGCHDNRMDKIWWNEQWMGWPVGAEYADQSNVTHAGELRGPLLLMVGEDDQNVDPASTFQVVNALIKANKDFELLVMPGHGHGVLGTAYGRRRMEQFFVRHLLSAHG